MMGWTIDELIFLAKVANATYDLDTQPAFEDLGLAWAGQVGNDQCQATIATWVPYALIAIRGTQVGQDPSLPELWDNVDPGVILSRDGNALCAGFWEPLVEIWPQVEQLMWFGGKPLIVGHSMGGVRAHLAKLLCPSAEVVSFGAPCGADSAAWTEMYLDGTYPTRIVNKDDFAPSWEPLGGWLWGCTQPGPMIWIDYQDRLEVLPERPPGIYVSLEDHSIDGSYLPSLERCVVP